jgi:hypothetical protein
MTDAAEAGRLRPCDRPPHDYPTSFYTFPRFCPLLLAVGIGLSMGSLIGESIASPPGGGPKESWIKSPQLSGRFWCETEKGMPNCGSQCHYVPFGPRSVSLPRESSGQRAGCCRAVPGRTSKQRASNGAPPETAPGPGTRHARTRCRGYWHGRRRLPEHLDWLSPE